MKFITPIAIILALSIGAEAQLRGRVVVKGRRQYQTESTAAATLSSGLEVVEETEAQKKIRDGRQLSSTSPSSDWLEYFCGDDWDDDAGDDEDGYDQWRDIFCNSPEPTVNNPCDPNPCVSAHPNRIGYCTHRPGLATGYSCEYEWITTEPPEPTPEPTPELTPEVSYPYDYYCIPNPCVSADPDRIGICDYDPGSTTKYSCEYELIANICVPNPCKSADPNLIGYCTYDPDVLYRCEYEKITTEPP